MSLLKKLFNAGHADVKLRSKKVLPDGSVYELYLGRSRKEAVAFLRGVEIKQINRTVVVETPEGNIAKDHVRIFKEFKRETIELGQRKQRHKPKPSLKACCMCEYPIEHFSRNKSEDPPDLSAEKLHEEMKLEGGGFVCRNCKTVVCAICAHPAGQPRCPICVQKITPLRFK